MLTEHGLSGAWRSLSGGSEQEGWRVIQIERYGPCLIHAGRRLPGNEEAILASFPEVTIPAARQLPHGHGFEVSRVVQQIAGSRMVTIGLIREPAGSLELFEAMAEDIMGVLRRGRDGSEESLLELFLRRVSAWQDFMRRPIDKKLSSEEEVGLFGELLMLEHLIEAGIPSSDVLDCWEGPLDGLQDFVIGAGAIEVKTSTAVTGFPARIGSLEQLDDSVRQPLYLAAQRVALGAHGETLAAFIQRLRSRFLLSGGSRIFESRLMHAGYRDQHAELYFRVFTPAGERLFLVGPDFPRLVAGMVNPAVRSAVYGIEVDQIEAEPVPLENALRSLGVI